MNLLKVFGKIKNISLIFSNIPKEIDLNRLKSDIKKLIPQAINFYNDYKDTYELIGCEIYLGDEDFDECGSADQMMLNKYTNEIALIDYKTNKKIEYESYRHKKMLVPLHKFEDCNYIHYSLQLEDYKFKFEKNTNLQVKEKFIVYFNINADNYEIIEPLEMKNEVKKILENRRCRNMKSIGVLLMGASGTGKSTSLRNLPAEETAIINVTNKPMPFRNKNGLKIVTCTNYEQMISAIVKTKRRIIVVDDSSYMMTFENFEKATQKGYDKFTTMAVNYYNLIETPKKCDGEKIIYFVTHEEIDENGVSHPKSIGKMLSQQLVIEGLFSIVLRSMQKENQYVFQTHNDGTSVCKSPIDMFENDFIPNDLAEVDKIIREYYDFKPITEKLEDTKVED